MNWITLIHRLDRKAVFRIMVEKITIEACWYCWQKAQCCTRQTGTVKNTEAAANDAFAFSKWIPGEPYRGPNYCGPDCKSCFAIGQGQGGRCPTFREVTLQDGIVLIAKAKYSLSSRRYAVFIQHKKAVVWLFAADFVVAEGA